MPRFTSQNLCIFYCEQESLFLKTLVAPLLDNLSVLFWELCTLKYSTGNFPEVTRIQTLVISLGIQNNFKHNPLSSQSLCRHNLSTTSGFYQSGRSQINPQQLDLNIDIYFSMRKWMCGVKVFETNRIRESHSPRAGVGLSADVLIEVYHKSVMLADGP